MRRFPRRAVLTGAGVTLALPWLSSLAGSSARAQTSPSRIRFLPIFLPNGAPELWKPPSAGRGAEWELSSVLEPLKALKAQVTVISGLENGSVFNEDGSSSVEPAHSRQGGAWLTCQDARVERRRLNVEDANGVSVDQLLAARLDPPTLVPSLQVGLSTTHSYCDGDPCSLSRSVSWRTPTEPLYKVVDPAELFTRFVGGGDPTPEQLEQILARQSVLDAVKESANAVRSQLSAADRLKLDEYLSSVRDLEQRRAGPAMLCPTPKKPSLPPITNDSFRTNNAGYDKGSHADAMNELVAWALCCDISHVISYMLEDQRSEFAYSHVPRRTFTATGSTLASGTCGEYHGAQTGSQDEYASITHWNVGKVAELCARLAQLPDVDGRSVLDNTVVLLGSAMHGSNHACADLPTLLIGGGGGKLRTDQHLVLDSRPMRDLYITLLNGVFDANVADFGVNRTGAPLASIDGLLA